MNSIVSKNEFLFDEAAHFLDHLSTEMQKEHRTKFNKTDASKLKNWFLHLEFDIKQFESQNS